MIVDNIHVAIGALADAIEELRPHGRARECVARARVALSVAMTPLGALAQAPAPKAAKKPAAKKKAARK